VQFPADEEKKQKKKNLMLGWGNWFKVIGA